MHKLMEYVCDELEELERKVAKDGKLTKTDFETAKDLSELKKNILKIDMLSENSEYSMGRGMDGYSRRMSYRDGGSYRGSYADSSYADGEYRAADGVRNYVRPDGSYADGGSSYARGRGRGAKRDSMGRYSSADDEMVMQLERLMDTAQDERTRSEIRKLIEKM